MDQFHRLAVAEVSSLLGEGERPPSGAGLFPCSLARLACGDASRNCALPSGPAPGLASPCAAICVTGESAGGPKTSVVESHATRSTSSRTNHVFCSTTGQPAKSRRLFCPICRAPFAKIFLFPIIGKCGLTCASRPHEGASRSSRNVVRDAMDAVMPQDVRCNCVRSSRVVRVPPI
jgi:hypothetical protein